MKPIPGTLQEGGAAFQTTHSSARESWTQARNELEFALKEQLESYFISGLLALTYMSLGENASVMTLAGRGIAANPIEKNAANGPPVTRGVCPSGCRNRRSRRGARIGSRSYD
jgi:hypothetical protein